MTNRATTPQKRTSARTIEVPRSPVPKSWEKVAGLLRGRKLLDPVAYQRQTRKEWEKRLKRQHTASVARSKHGSR